MRLLNLDLLVGPANTVAENFELLCLELVKVQFPDHDCFQIRAPDGGIDLYARSPSESSGSRVYQCKAYRTFIPSLAIETTASVSKAIASRALFPWTNFTLCIPFVPTFKQRTRLEGILRFCETVGCNYDIWDSNTLETMLFAHKTVARRFWPSVIIATPPDSTRFILGSLPSKETIKVNFAIHSWEQSIPVTFDIDASVGSVLSFILGQLDYGTQGEIVLPGLRHPQKYRLYWNIVVERPQPKATA